MPNGIFPVPQFDVRPSHVGAESPSLVVRVRARVRRKVLDWQLAHGADPAENAELRLRAAQLRSHAVRSRLANALEEALGDARRAEPVTIKSRASHRAKVRATADDLLALVLRLRDPEPVELRGMAMVAQLLSDAESPLRRDGEQDLQDAIRAARFALDAPVSGAHDLAAAA
jgi:hypothetical protein